MLKFLSKVKIEFNALDPRMASCMEFLAQCNAHKAKESNPACQLQVKRRTDDHPPQITVAFVNGVEEVFNATSTPAQTIRTMILRKGQMLETEHMFREAGEKWPIIIPEELHQFFPGTKVWAFFSSGLDKLEPQVLVVNLMKHICTLDVPYSSEADEVYERSNGCARGTVRAVDKTLSMHARERQSEMDELRRDGSVQSFSQLGEMFLGRFKTSRTIMSTPMGLMSVKQREGESLKDYVKRFHAATLNMKNLEDQWAIDVFIMGV
ncbi:hypothetical protein Gotur_008349, partial [Gossypium turneri]